MDKFIIEKADDFFEAAILIIRNELNAKEIHISESFNFVIKIDDPLWSDSSIFDYKKANVIVKLQEDLLGVYNKISGEKVSIDDLKNRQELVINVSVKDGCIEYISKFFPQAMEWAKGMEPDQQFLSFLIACGVVATGLVSWAAVKISSNVKDIKLKRLENEERSRFLESQDKAVAALAANNSTPKYIVKNISAAGRVSICNEEMVEWKDIPDIEENYINAEAREITMHIDGEYPIKKYDFDTQDVQIALGKRTVWLATKHLLDFEREKIRKIADKSISLCVPIRERLQVTATKSEDNKIFGIIVGIGDPRPTSVSYTEFLSAKFTEPTEDRVGKLPITFSTNK